MDVKSLERIPGTQKRLYQFIAIDDCTRLRVLKVYDPCNQRPAIQFDEEVLRRLPFRVLVIQTDNGAEFQSQFHWYLEQRDIRHLYIRPRSPHLNGKVERSHRVDDQEFYQLLDQDGVSDDITCSTTNCVKGRTTTTIIGRTAHSAGRPRTSGSWPRPEPECHRRLRALQATGFESATPCAQDGCRCQGHRRCRTVCEMAMAKLGGFASPPSNSTCNSRNHSQPHNSRTRCSNRSRRAFTQCE